MKILKTLIAAVSLLLVFSGCGDGLGNREIEIGNPEDFVVDLRGLNLVKKLVTVYNIPIDQSALGFAKIPSFATRDEVTWTSSNQNVAEVDEKTGEITIKITNPNAPQATTMIRVQSDYDPSIYAECALTVHPIYGLPRTWNFAANTIRVDGSVITASSGTTASGWTNQSSEANLGNGAIILGMTSFASDYNGLSPGEYVIDPDDPYRHGVVLTELSRNWNYVNTNGAQVPTGFSEYMIRPTGAARFIEINALFGPFKIEVNYAGNNTSGSHVDIRIGDTAGIRIEGENSMSNTDGQTVTYTFTESEVFVPVVYLETNDGTRIWDIKITRQ